MEKINTLREYLAELREQLDGSRFDQIDFDGLAETLADLDGLLDACQVREQELAALRGDYIERIEAMVKGIAAVYRDRRTGSRAVVETEGLSSMSGQDLVACFRRVSAQFREAFPSSFAAHSGGSAVLPAREDIGAYK